MSVPAPPGDDLPARLRLALTAALRARDVTAVAALRSALAAIGNAEAARRRLSPAQVAAIVQAEIDERLAAAAQYQGAGHADRAARLTAEARALAAAAGGAE